jgi:hypothetical protein
MWIHVGPQVSRCALNQARYSVTPLSQVHPSSFRTVCRGHGLQTMDFILRNLEALGDEVAAALEDLADEVTGRGRTKQHDSDVEDDDGASDDRSVASVERQNGWAASDSAGSDTASCTSDNDGAVDAVPVPAMPPLAPTPMTVPVKAPSAHVRRRKPLLCGTKLSTSGDDGADSGNVAPAADVPQADVTEYQPTPPTVAGDTRPVPEKRTAQADTATGMPSQVVTVSPSAGSVGSAARSPGYARRRSLPPAAPAASTTVASGEISQAFEPPDDAPIAVDSIPTVSVLPPPRVEVSPPGPKTASPSSRRKGRHMPQQGSSEFDLCEDEAAVQPKTPTVEGDYLVL